MCQHASSYTSESGTVPLFNGSEQGLASALFILLDSETDAVLQRHIRDTITGLLTSLAEQQLSGWLNLCKEVLTASAESAPTTIEQQRVQSPSGYPLKAAGSETMDADAGDDEEEFRAGVEQATATTRGRPIGLKFIRNLLILSIIHYFILSIIHLLKVFHFRGGPRGYLPPKRPVSCCCCCGRARRWPTSIWPQRDSCAQPSSRAAPITWSFIFPI